MPNGLFNWSYKDVVKFLKENSFEFLEYRKGSHEAWTNHKTKAILEISFHGQKRFIPKTLESMIRQSKIDKKEWRKWAGR